MTFTIAIGGEPQVVFPEHNYTLVPIVTGTAVYSYSFVSSNSTEATMGGDSFTYHYGKPFITLTVTNGVETHKAYYIPLTVQDGVEMINDISYYLQTATSILPIYTCTFPDNEDQAIVLNQFPGAPPSLDTDTDYPTLIISIRTLTPEFGEYVSDTIHNLLHEVKQLYIRKNYYYLFEVISYGNYVDREPKMGNAGRYIFNVTYRVTKQRTVYL